jgi:hypothetical protein
VRIIEELIEWKGSGSGKEVGTNFADKRRSLGIVRLRTKSHGVFFLSLFLIVISRKEDNIVTDQKHMNSLSHCSRSIFGRLTLAQVSSW